MNSIEDDLPAFNAPPVVSKAAAENKEKAPRKLRPKLDYDRLLKGPKGFAHLRAHTKFTLQNQISGKPGSEAADLAEIVTFLQEWAKLLFPKATLTEFLKKIEELCDSRLMKDYLHDMQVNPQGDGMDFMTNRLLEESKLELVRIESTEATEDFDVAAELEKAAEKKPSIKEFMKRGKRQKKQKLQEDEEEDEVADDDESMETSEDDSDDHGTDLEDFINDGSEEEGEEVTSPLPSSSESEAELEAELESEREFEEDEKATINELIESESDAESVKESKQKKVKRTILESDEEEVEAAAIARIESDDEPTPASKPKSNAILFSDDE